MSFWNNPENNALKVLLLVVVLAGAGIFVVNDAHSGTGNATGQVIGSSSTQIPAGMLPPGVGAVSSIGVPVNAPTTQSGSTSSGTTTGGTGAGTTGGAGASGTGATPPAATLFPAINIGANPTGSLASAMKVLYVQGTSVFAGGIGIRGQLGIAQNDGSTIPTSTPGYNTIYVQGVPVCLRDGSNCPQSGASMGSNNAGAATVSSSVLPFTSKGPITSQGAWIGWNNLTGGTGETDFINSKGEGKGGFAFMNGGNGSPSASSEKVLGTLDDTGTLSVPGSVNALNESHFGVNGKYIDPVPGVPVALKANSIATGKLLVDGEIPIMRINPACFEGHQQWVTKFPVPMRSSNLGLLVAVVDIPFGIIASIANISQNIFNVVFNGGTNWNDDLLKSSVILTTDTGCTNKYGTYYKNIDYGVFGFVIPGIPPKDAGADVIKGYSVLGTDHK
ncbi:MAG: hypothetical protein WCG55_00085 [bacterium]